VLEAQAEDAGADGRADAAVLGAALVVVEPVVETAGGLEAAAVLRDLKLTADVEVGFAEGEFQGADLMGSS